MREESNRNVSSCLDDRTSRLTGRSSPPTSRPVINGRYSNRDSCDSATREPPIPRLKSGPLCGIRVPHSNANEPGRSVTYSISSNLIGMRQKMSQAARFLPAESIWLIRPHSSWICILACPHKSWN